MFGASAKAATSFCGGNGKINKRWPSAKNDGDYAATCSSRPPNIQRREGIRLAAGETRALDSGTADLVFENSPIFIEGKFTYKIK